MSLKALSFFSGAMGLDLGLERSGVEILLACEFNKKARQTIKANRPHIPLIDDICNYSADEIRRAAGLSESDDIDMIVGGPPCQPFSTMGARRGLEDVRSNALLRYLELIRELKPRYFVLENVRGLYSATLADDDTRGGILQYIVNYIEDEGYAVSYNLYNAANFGVPQARERVVMICNREGERMPWLNPTHSETGAYGLPKWRTLRDALEGLPEFPCDCNSFPEKRLRWFRMLKQGQNWKDLPKEFYEEALGGSYRQIENGSLKGTLRRLAWDKPCCTLVTSPTMPATDMCHPDKDRPLSIQEYKRIQQFPDDWIVCGLLGDKYRQIGNAVPVGLGEAIGRAVTAHANGTPVHPPIGFPFSRYNQTNDYELAYSGRQLEFQFD